MGLALHELATNAVKYGAFARPSGPGSGGPEVALEGRESGVPMPDGAVPPRRG